MAKTLDVQHRPSTPQWCTRAQVPYIGFIMVSGVFVRVYSPERKPCLFIPGMFISNEISSVRRP